METIYKPNIISLGELRLKFERYFKMPANTLYNRRDRYDEFKRPRQMAHYTCCLFKDQFKWSLFNIGVEFGRKDHSTVLHSKKTIQNQIDTYDLFDGEKVETHINNLKNELDALYQSKKRKTPLGTETQILRPTTRAQNRNKLLSHTSMASISQQLHCGQSPLRRMLTQQQNGTSQSMRPYKTNKSSRSIRYAEREIWGAIKRRKCTIIV